MRRHLVLACWMCVWITERTVTSAVAFCGEVPTATELRGLVLEPLRSLQFGTYKLQMTEHWMGRTAATRMTFKGECLRFDKFGLESVTFVRDKAGGKRPFVADPATEFVMRESLCGEEFITYNPAREKGRAGFSVSVQKLSDPIAASRVRDNFFDPRSIGLTPGRIGHLRLDSWSNSLYESVAVEASVSQVKLEGEDVLLLEQRRDRGQVIRHWVSPLGYAVVMAEVMSGEGKDRSGNRMKITNQRVVTPTTEISFPRRIEGFEIDNNNALTLQSEYEIVDIDFKTAVEDRVFTVLGMEPTEGTHVYTQPPHTNPLREIRDGQVVPATRINSEPALAHTEPVKESRGLLPILFINIVAIAVCFGVAYRLKRGRSK